MGTKRETFGRLLTEAIYSIKATQGKNVSTIEYELNIAIGRETESLTTAIGYWRRGHIPKSPLDVFNLAQAIVHRHGFDFSKCEKFLRIADYPNPSKVAQSICGSLDTPNIGSALSTNPFIVGPPIESPQQFFGRHQEVKQIFSTLNRHPLQHFALIGPRRSGKSSLLKYIRKTCYTTEADLRASQSNNWLKQPGAYQWVNIDFQDPRTHTMSRLLKNILEQVGCSHMGECDLDNFMDLFIPCLDRPTIILMDEIGAALSATDLPVQLWWGLRSIVNGFSNGNLSFIISSHYEPAKLAEDKGKSSPFFNIFSLIDVKPFTIEDIEEFFENAPLEIASDEKSWIIDQSQMWPILVQLFTQFLWSQKVEGSIDDWQETGLAQLKQYTHLLE